MLYDSDQESTKDKYALFLCLFLDIPSFPLVRLAHVDWAFHRVKDTWAVYEYNSRHTIISFC